MPVAIDMGTSSGTQVAERIQAFGIYGKHVVDNKIGKGIRLVGELISARSRNAFPDCAS